jgi:ATP-dependent helicase Lhr and Lhr-like helicase
LDEEVIEEHERALQRRTYPVKHADGVHDLLLSIGDLTIDEITERASPPEEAAAWVRSLERDRRIVAVKIKGKARYIAAEDVGRFRDALGISPPVGIPAAFLEPVSDPLGDLVARYARTHGPFVEGDLKERFGIGLGTIEASIARLVRAGRIVEGAFLPHGRTRELCDAEVLRALRRKSLARLRREIEPVDAAAYARFLLEWQGVTRPRRGHDALSEVIAQLQGCPIAASALES